MENWDWTIREKPYDLRERLFLFACRIVRVVQFLHTRGPVAKALSYQLLKCGTSAVANYEEADDGSSKRDAVAKKLIVLRELKESHVTVRFWQLAIGTCIPLIRAPRSQISPSIEPYMRRLCARGISAPDTPGRRAWTLWELGGS